jgi:hypothetical protein
LREHVDVENFHRLLATLPDDAAKFWHPHSQRP